MQINTERAFDLHTHTRTFAYTVGSIVHIVPNLG